MKNRHFERMRRTMLEHHRRHPWKLNGGLFIPHRYPSSKTLSWWADFGFIHGRHRVMVWWIHPRMKYADAIENKAFEIAGPMPIGSPIEERKLSRPPRSLRRIKRRKSSAFKLTDRRIEYFDRVTAIEDRLREEGIEQLVFPSFTIKRYPWGMGVSLCIPMEILTLCQLRELAGIAKQLVKREIMLSEAFPGKGYSKQDWLQDMDLRKSHPRDSDSRP